MQFQQSERYCRSGRISVTSQFRTLSVAHISASATTNIRGRYSCQAYAQRQACNCGWSATTRITNGREAAKHEFPFMVALRDIGSSQRIFCGGSIGKFNGLYSKNLSNRKLLKPSHIYCFKKYKIL